MSISSQFILLIMLQISICRPTEDGMDVEASTQWLDLTQQSTAMVLGVPESRYSVSSCSVEIKVTHLWKTSFVL